MTECIPGSTDEQLPAHILDLLYTDQLTYCSTACEAALNLAQAQADLHVREGTPDIQSQLTSWRRTLHNRCRLTNKFTGTPCSCSCHHPDAS